MSLQRRLLVYLLLCAPLVWALALYASVGRARVEVNELFDTELIRLARQVQATMRSVQGGSGGTLPPPQVAGDMGEADVKDLAIAVWNAQGQLLLADREGVQLPRRPDAAGFAEASLGGEPWRLYYLQAPAGEWLVAAGQKLHERDELVFKLTSSQIAPWLVVLPVLLAAMAWAVRQALAPLHRLSAQLRGRDASDLTPVAQQGAPAELQPLVDAMNGLFARIADTLARERRFTSDAAHELRTPLAVLRAQWDVLRAAAGEAEREAAAAKLGAGLERMDRLVTQMLALSRVESAARPAQAAPVHWPAIVEQVMSDCLATAERRRIELACDWPADGQEPLPMSGDPHLLAVLLRNLLDNAVQYAPPGSAVTLSFGADRIEVENDGPPLPPQELARLGERFHRPSGQSGSGSGLGISIVRRIAALHGLQVDLGPRGDGQGMKVVVRRAMAAA